jgi:hypothetical protein
MADAPQVIIPAGHVVMTTHGSVRQESAQCWADARSLCERNGLLNISWRMVPGALPEKTRNDAVRALLSQPDAGWLLQIDADMTWRPDAVMHILHTAYALLPHADVVGAWCPLRGDMAIPTIDTGTGTWESVFPNNGPVEVIRTGAAFHLTKRHVYENLADPWYRIRVPARPIDFMLEVDNWARIKFDGRNPFRDLPGEPWERLLKCAKEDPSVAPGAFVPGEVGEDSAFMDRVRAAGFRIFVQTDIECGHVDVKVLGAADHKRAMDNRDRMQRLLTGVTA